MQYIFSRNLHRVVNARIFDVSEITIITEEMELIGIWRKYNGANMPRGA